MNILVTGQLGAAKTLYVMSLLETDDFLGLPVYSNIDGADELSNHQKIPDMDWRLTPPGSVVIYDEAQKEFGSTGRAGSSSDPRVHAMAEARHTGHTLIFITPRYADVHHQLRGYIGRHVHLIARMGKTSAKFENTEVFDPSDRRAIASLGSGLFHHPVHLYDRYRSSSLHSSVKPKLIIPKRVIFIVIFIALLLFAVFYFGAKGLSVFSHSAAQTVASAGSSVLPSGSSLLSSSTDNGARPHFVRDGYAPLKGCIFSASSCQCFASDGAPIMLDDTSCRHAAVSHSYISLAPSGGSSSAFVPPPPVSSSSVSSSDPVVSSSSPSSSIASSSGSGFEDHSIYPHF